MEALVGSIAEGLLEQGKAEGLAMGKAEGLAMGKAEGLAMGKAEGLAMGKAEGLATGKAETLVRQLERRFGPLAADARGRVATAGVADIDAWLDAVIDAPDLPSVFGEGRRH